MEEKKFAVVRCLSDGKDVVTVRAVIIANGKTLAAARRDVLAVIKKENEVTSVTWMGWFDIGLFNDDIPIRVN